MPAGEMNSAKRALVIDDDDVARELLASTMRAAGFTTFELPSPIGATQLLVREGIRLLVIDVQMPDMNGDKLAKLLRKNERLQSLAILLVSGCDDPDLDRLAADVKADGVVLKRDVRAQLVAAARRALHFHSAKEVAKADDGNANGAKADAKNEGAKADPRAEGRKADGAKGDAGKGNST